MATDVSPVVAVDLRADWPKGGLGANDDRAHVRRSYSPVEQLEPYPDLGRTYLTGMSRQAGRWD